MRRAACPNGERRSGSPQGALVRGGEVRPSGVQRHEVRDDRESLPTFRATCRMYQWQLQVELVLSNAELFVTVVWIAHRGTSATSNAHDPRRSAPSWRSARCRTRNGPHGTQPERRRSRQRPRDVDLSASPRRAVPRNLRHRAQVGLFRVGAPAIHCKRSPRLTALHPIAAPVTSSRGRSRHAFGVLARDYPRSSYAKNAIEP